uniref:Uncharacterized protein n=1 Tax=Siphoviridae sp. ct0D87 TaxID=2827760 RepID=A0A8S5SB89_9CAUD|nr:MAG TPA: hypothetical protein [Siphoviridae sp. ct0D87]
MILLTLETLIFNLSACSLTVHPYILVLKIISSSLVNKARLINSSRIILFQGT